MDISHYFDANIIGVIGNIHQSTENSRKIHSTRKWHTPVNRKSIEKYASSQWYPQFHIKSNHTVDGNHRNSQKIHSILNINPWQWEPVYKKLKHVRIICAG